MRRIFLALALILAPTFARADTITITLSGSSLSGLTGTPSMSYTLSDSDLTNLISWGKTAFAGCFAANSIIPANATNAQVLQCWISTLLYEGTVTAVQQFMVSPPAVPTPIGVTPSTGAASH